MASTEIIDLCSDDSTVTSEVTAPTSHRGPLKTHIETPSTTRRRTNRPSYLKDIDLDLDDLFPLPVAKRRRAEEVRQTAGPSLEAATAKASTETAMPGLGSRALESLLDPISSSSPLPVPPRRKNPAYEIVSDDWLSLGSDGVAAAEDDKTNLAEQHSPVLSTRTSTLLAEISANRNPKGGQRTGKRATTIESEVQDGDERPQERTSTKAAERKAEREARKAEKDAAKAASAEQRRRERERKAMEKELAANHAEANKARWDKKISTAEMIVDLPESMAEGHLSTELQRILQDAGAKFATYDAGAISVVKWRRKSKNIYNPEKNSWDLRPEVILDEPNILCISQGQEFVQRIHSDEGCEEINGFLDEVKTKYPGRQILYIIQGLESYLKKQRTLKNRSYVASVRQESQSSKNKAAAELQVNEDKVEDALIQLPITHGCYIFQTINALETAEWIGDFTQHLSTVPYRQERHNLDSQFCMESGQVKAGDDAQDIFVRALQQVVRVTAPIAYAIARQYSDVPSLVDAFEQHGPLALEDIKKCIDKEGTTSNARIGPQISRRLARVFLGRDPDSIDI